MNCQEFWDSYPELAQTPDPTGHAAQCEACARQLSEQMALAAGLRAAAIDWRQTQAPDRVERGLVSAFRSHQTVQIRPRRTMWLPVLTWASAAAVLVVLAILTIRGGNRPLVPRHPAPRSVEWAAVSAPADWVSEDDSANGEFIPLPNAQQLGENEDMNVVRMEVPRSAMMAVGLPVSLDRASELVEADVMLGSDGLARAIRFVDE